jgi:hypothetical protein
MFTVAWGVVGLELALTTPVGFVVHPERYFIMGHQFGGREGKVVLSLVPLRTTILFPF